MQLRFRKPRKKLKICRKENNFPQNVPMYMQNAVVTTLPKFSPQNSENFLLEFRKWWKTDKISSKPTCKIVHLNMHKEILTNLPKHCRQEYEKHSQIPHEMNIHFFEQNCFCFIKKGSLATENAILTTLAKTFL